MSDPMKSADIEDVLSSIRRLVADTPDGAQAPATVAGNRLVLTPALRVGEAQAQAHAEAAQSPAPSQQDAADTPAQADADGAPHHSADDDAPTPYIEPEEDTMTAPRIGSRWMPMQPKMRRCMLIMMPPMTMPPMMTPPR
ncbi:MAG: hypothetical protein ACO3VR_01405 [Lutimaribacter sp.]